MPDTRDHNRANPARHNAEHCIRNGQSDRAHVGLERFLTVSLQPVIPCARKGHVTVPRTTNRSPEERFLANRRIFVGGMLFEAAAGIALLFLLSWPTNIIVVGSGAVILIAYNFVFWQTLKKQAADQSAGNTSEPP